MNDNGIVIGRCKVKRAVVVTETFECAAWYRKVKVKPGIYEIVAYPNRHEQSVGHQLYVRCIGEVVDASFQSRLGAHYGRDDGSKEIGQIKQTHITLSPFGTVGDRLWENTHPDYAVRYNPALVDLSTYEVAENKHILGTTPAYTGWMLWFRSIQGA